jgi:ferric-dicitrate binding protein FerR (iron transport regulator)
MTLRDLLAVRPPEPLLSEAGRRARIRALARLDAERRAPRAWLLPAAAVFTLALAMVVFVQTPLRPPAHPTAEALRMDLTLTDGTRVVWTFDDRLGL